MKTNLTIHTIVKNEPFLYYAIKSIYDYCDTILLYDTGSNDAHTLEDIETLLSEDKNKKIVFKQISIYPDEEKWSVETIKKFTAERQNKFTKGRVRQIQINDTKTKYFMLVDGDEVHYRAGMEKIVKELLPNNLYNNLCVGLPLIWFYDMDNLFTERTFPYNGRIMPTDAIYMNNDSPNEKHLMKENGNFFTYKHPKYLCYEDCTPYAHFETVLKPWRRKHLVSKKNITPFLSAYPEVIYENSYYIARWMEKEKQPPKGQLL